MANAQRRLTPRGILKVHAIGWALGQGVAFLFLAQADATNDARAFSLIAIFLAGWSPLVALAAYVSVKRAWQGIPVRDFRDGVLPAAVLVGLGWLVWWLIHRLNQ